MDSSRFGLIKSLCENFRAERPVLRRGRWGPGKGSSRFNAAVEPSEPDFLVAEGTWRPPAQLSGARLDLAGRFGWSDQRAWLLPVVFPLDIYFRFLISKSWVKFRGIYCLVDP